MKGWFGNYVIKRSTLGLTLRHHGHCIAAIVLFELRARCPGCCYRRSSGTNPSSLWGWLGMVMVSRASLKRTLLLIVSQNKFSNPILGTILSLLPSILKSLPSGLNSPDDDGGLLLLLSVEVASSSVETCRPRNDSGGTWEFDLI